MGCGNTKGVVIPESALLTTTIDELPVEIIYKILDELDVCTIFASFYIVSKHFKAILSTYNQYHLNLKSVSLTNFRLICSRIRPDQVTELTLSDDEYTPGLVELFLSRFTINTFVRLRSLTLIQIDSDEFMTQILIPIADRTILHHFSSLKIINRDESYSDIFTELITTILSKPSLRLINLDLSYNRTTSNSFPWTDQSSIRHMTFPSSCTVGFVRNTFSFTPLLETFKIDDLDFDEEVDLTNAPNDPGDDLSLDAEMENEIIAEPDNEENIEPIAEANNEEIQVLRKELFAPITPTDNLTSLTLNICTISMSKLEWLLQEMTALKRLQLITTVGYDDDSILDGGRWERLVSNMDSFEFVFSVNISDSLIWDTTNCLTTFQSPFWIEDKQWFISLEKYDDEVILYTLPYLNEFYVLKNKSSSFEYRSTAIENSVLQVQSMNNVRDLYIDVGDVKEAQLENVVLPRFSHVTHLFLYGKWPRSKLLLSNISIFVDLNTVEELIRQDSLPTVDFMALLVRMTNLHSIKTTTNLLDALSAAKFSHDKCLRSLIVDPIMYGDQRSVNIEPFCAMFPRIQYLTIPIENIDSCQYALDQLNQDLISIVFHLPTNDSVFEENEEEDVTVDVFSEWIKHLPERYRCHRKQRQVQVWLK